MCGHAQFVCTCCVHYSTNSLSEEQLHVDNIAEMRKIEHLFTKKLIRLNRLLKEAQWESEWNPDLIRSEEKILLVLEKLEHHLIEYVAQLYIFHYHTAK